MNNNASYRFRKATGKKQHSLALLEHSDIPVRNTQAPRDPLPATSSLPPVGKLVLQSGVWLRHNVTPPFGRKTGEILLVLSRLVSYFQAMKHRHINPEQLTTVAIDDIIERGGRVDWAALRDSAALNPGIWLKILRVCAARSDDPGAQRYHLWRHYAGQRVA